ncbi:50S ribosomal protein L21 [Patescibacteria group bacterium]|nr:50S ribosomal protein L21 [Patescibacteria group bacterium]MBU1890355.1 50S ribosomal protein L21 [Patescibacteria group bacterium]
MIAVIKTGGKQYTVEENDKIKIEKIPGKEGAKVSFKEVLLISDKLSKALKVGTPKVAKAHVEAKVLKQDKDKKVTVIKYKSKIRYRRQYGHRQLYTQVQIEKIVTA